MPIGQQFNLMYLNWSDVSEVVGCDLMIRQLLGERKNRLGSPGESFLLELCFVADVGLDLENFKAQDACWKGLVAVRGQVWPCRITLKMT